MSDKCEACGKAIKFDFGDAAAIVYMPADKVLCNDCQVAGQVWAAKMAKRDADLRAPGLAAELVHIGVLRHESESKPMPGSDAIRYYRTGPKEEKAKEGTP